MNILFITHESSRTGAPLMLLYFMEWLLTYRKDVSFDVLTLKPGVMDEDFERVAQNRYKIEKNKKGGLKQQLIKKIEKKVLKRKNENQATLTLLKENSYDVVYANSVVALPMAHSLKSTHTKLIAHIHEMSFNIKKYAPNFDELIPSVDRFIAASKAVKKDLMRYKRIKENDIAVIYEISKVKHTPSNSIKKGFTVGGSGLVGWRKGTDIFVQIANYIHRHFKGYDIRFVWVGRISDSQRSEIDSDLEKMKLTEKVELTGETSDPYAYFEDFDVFLLTSREDPFPLVCIEVGMLGKPILCFENATGSSEMLADQKNTVIPYLDIRKMAEQIIHLHDTPEDRKRLGDANKKSFSNFTPEKVCPGIMDVLDTLVG